MSDTVLDVITTHDQKLSDLATEFVTAMTNSKGGGPDGDDLFNAYVSMEQNNNYPEEMEKMITDIGPSHMNAYSLPFFKNCKPRISTAVFAWIVPMSCGIPMAIEVYIGLYAVEFYKTHARSEEMTLAWMGEHGARGKIINFREMFPWYMASLAKGKERTCALSVITPEQLYRA